MADEYFLTTIDNPYSPFKQFDEWYKYDVQMGYNTCSYLARIANVSSSLSDEMNSRIINDAIDEICDLNLLGIYRKVKQDQ